MNTASAPALGIDFGTSNSAAAALGADGRVRLLPVEGSHTNLPTAVFFNAEERGVHFGREAVALYLAGVEGRLMRSLKSLLGSSLLFERTQLPEGTASFQDIIARFLRELRARAGTELGALPGRAVIGRPVHFVDGEPERDRQAEAALREAARSAGFAHVAFELEPIAAAFDYEQRLATEQRVLIVDIGGGTSDFTVLRLGPGRTALPDRRADILATTGLHIGGTDYDRALNLAAVQPLLGLGHTGKVRAGAPPGAVGRPLPSGVFFDLATWHLIALLANPRRIREAEALRDDFADPRLHARLVRVLRERLGHRIASAVEAAKIDVSVRDAAARIDLDAVEAGLAAVLEPQGVARTLDALLQPVVDCAADCVRAAGTPPDAIYLTGGSSALRPFQAALQARFPGVPLVQGDLFGGVASGLALVAGRS